jgi:hypothetical protein
VAGLFGIGFVLVPAQLLSQYGITTDAPFDLVGQLFGAALIGFAVLTWAARNATDSDAGRAIHLAGQRSRSIWCWRWDSGISGLGSRLWPEEGCASARPRAGRCRFRAALTLS